MLNTDWLTVLVFVLFLLEWQMCGVYYLEFLNLGKV